MIAMKNLLPAFLGALAALLINEVWRLLRNASSCCKLCSLCLYHMRIIQRDLKNNVDDHEQERAKFDQTQYCESSVGVPLYDTIVSSIHLFPDAEAIRDTIIFFHHYKVNMATIKSRMETKGKTEAYVTRHTYDGILEKLDAAIRELEGIRFFGLLARHFLSWVRYFFPWQRELPL